MAIKKELLSFCKEHSTEFACFCIGVGVGFSALGYYCFGSIFEDQSSVILTVKGECHKNVAKNIGDWWSSIGSNKKVARGIAGIKSMDFARGEIECWINENKKDFDDVAFLLIGCKNKK